MFKIDEKYLIDKEFKPSDFATKDLSRSDKKKIKETIKKATLKYQIKGEEIPSLIDETYNYQVIMFFEMELSNLKSANYINNLLQKEVIKAPCVFKFKDLSSCCYAFADKRLSMQEEKVIVIDSSFTTTPQPNNAQQDQRLLYGNVKNKNNKRSFYTELMVKTYILDNSKLIQGLMTVFDTSLWYDERRKMDFFNQLKELQTMKLQQNKTVIAQEKVELNRNMKKLIDELKKLYEVGNIE
jgi:hypothetical protein